MLSSPSKKQQQISVNIETLLSPTKSSSQKFVKPKIVNNETNIAVRKTACTVGHQYVAWPEKLPKKEYMEQRLQLIEKKRSLLLEQLEEIVKKKEELKKKKYLDKQKIVKRSKSLPPPSEQKEEEARLAAEIRDKNDEVKYLEAKLLEEKFTSVLKSTNNSLNKSLSRPSSVSGRSVSGKSIGSEKSFISDVSSKRPRYASLTVSHSMPNGSIAPNHFEKQLRKTTYRPSSSKPFVPSGNKNGREYRRPRPLIPPFQSERQQSESTGMLSPHHVAAGTTIEPLKVSFRRGGVSATVSRSAVPQEAMRAIANAQESFIARQRRAFELDRQRRIKLALASASHYSRNNAVTKTISTSIKLSENKKESKKSLKSSKKKKKSVRKAGLVKIPAETLTRRRESIEEKIKPIKKKKIAKKKKLVVPKVIISKGSNASNDFNDEETEKRIESATASILSVIENTVDQNVQMSSKKKKLVKKKNSKRV